MNKKIILCVIGLLTLAVGIHLSIEPLYIPTAIITPHSLFRFPQITTCQHFCKNTPGHLPMDTSYAIQEILGSSVDGISVDVLISREQGIFLHKESGPLIKLSDFLACVGSQKMLFLNVQRNALHGISMHKIFAKKLASLIQKYHLQETVFVASSDPLFLTIMRLTSRDILLMYNMKNDTSNGIFQYPWVQKQVRRVVRPDLLCLDASTDQSALKNLIRSNYPTIISCVDNPKIAEKFYHMGVKGIQTCRPGDMLFGISCKKRLSYDAGGTKARSDEVIPVHSTNDIILAIKRARKENKCITIAGRRHSMGGQALLDHSLQLDMLSFNRISYNPETKTITAQAGATWKNVQKLLNIHKRSVLVMQSDNIFTIGGSVSVNVHGWQVNEGPIASTIVGMTVITADGKIRKISPQHDPLLFSLVVGGYGLFAVIVEVEFKTTQNSELQFHARFTNPQNFSQIFEKMVSNNPKVELAYARLCVDHDKLFDEVGIFWYERVSKRPASQELQQEPMVALKRGIFRMSQYADSFKKLRWISEKYYANRQVEAGVLSRNNAMNTDIHILWPLYGKNKDILHEYFIPQKNAYAFIQSFKQCILKHKMNILNVTIRDVKRDTISHLSYARKDVFAFVCLFSQSYTDEDEHKMENFTKDAIQRAVELGGTFYLPYRLHYDKALLKASYPMIERWIEHKNTYDPSYIFKSIFFEHILTSVLDKS